MSATRSGTDARSSEAGIPSRALAVNDSDPEANYGLAMVFAQMDDTERALAHFRRR